MTTCERPKDADRFGDLKRAIGTFRTYLADRIGAALGDGVVFECSHLNDESFLVPSGDRPGVYIFLLAQSGDLDQAEIAYIGKSQQICGVRGRIVENHTEYQHPKNRDYPVTHCVAFTFPSELHFLAPALESYLLSELRTLDNSRLRG